MFLIDHLSLLDRAFPVSECGKETMAERCPVRDALGLSDQGHGLMLCCSCDTFMGSGLWSFLDDTSTGENRLEVLCRK